MSELNPSAAAPDPAMTAPPARPRRFVWPRSALVGGALVAGVALGAGGLAAAAAAPDHFGWHKGPRLERIQGFVLRTLDAIGASSDQESKIHDIVAKNFDALAPDPARHMELRKQALELLRAPTLDRAAIEKLRADQIAAIDARSKALVGTLLDAADVLTPEQRVKLADRLEQWRPGGPHGWRQGPDGWRHGPRDGRPGPDGPDGPGRDNGPGDDKPDNG